MRGEARPVEAMGLTFPGVLGLAAGFDKNAEGIDALAALGFGFVEIGTVTGEPQPGNDRPRLFRLPADRAIVNRMGFNNDGAEAVAAAARRPGLEARPATAIVVLGVNIGKTKVVPEAEAVARLREEHPAAGAARRLPRRQRLLAQHARPARPPGRREAPPAARRGARHRGRRDAAARAAARQDRARPRRQGRARRRRPRARPGSRRHRRDQHDDQPRRAWPPTRRRSRRPAPAGSRAPR